MSADPRDRTHLRPIDDELDHPPPHDLDAERSILGAILARPHQSIPIAADTLDPTDFYQPAHEHIYDVVVTMYVAGDVVDPLTVWDHLDRRGSSGSIPGGRIYLHDLHSLAPAVASVGHHADIVATKAEMRRAAAAGRRITADAEHGRYDPTVAADLLAAVPSPLRKTGTTTWAPVDLRGLRSTGITRPTATLLTTTAGRGLIYPRAVHSISGEPTSGKSWIALVAVAQEITAGHPVTYIDFEDRPETLIARLDDLGASAADVDRLVRYIRPEDALTPAHAATLDTATAGCRVVVVDGVTEAMTLHHLDLSKNPDVAVWLELLPRRIANTGPAVWQIDHVVKDSESRGRYAIGGQHKLAGIVAAYSMLVAKPFAPGQGGHARVIVQKDRHGDVGTVGQTVAELHMTPAPDRTPTAATCSLTGSSATLAEDGAGGRLTGYMERVSKMIEVVQGMSQNDIVAACGGKERYVIRACRTLVSEGHARTEPGKRGAFMYHCVRPFREDQ